MRTRYSISTAVLVVCVAIPGMARQATVTGPSAEISAAAPQSAQSTPSYVIGAQDVLNISVWKNAELTQTVPVRPDGKISMPLLNDIQAAGLTPDQLKVQITDGLKRFMSDPVVTVIVTEINSQRIFVTGEVLHAGAFPLLPNMTLLQALSSAGGFTQFANQKKIYMFRVVNGKQVNFPFNYKDVIHGKNAGENVVLRAGDTIVVP